MFSVEPHASASNSIRYFERVSTQFMKLERALDGAGQVTRVALPHEFPVRAKNEFVGNGRDIEGGECLSGTVPDGPFDSGVRNEGLRRRQRVATFRCQTDEDDILPLELFVDLNQVGGRTVAGASPIGEAFNDDDLAQQIRVGYWLPVHPALGLNRRHVSAGTQRRGRFCTADDGYDSDQTDHSLCQRV